MTCVVLSGTLSYYSPCLEDSVRLLCSAERLTCVNFLLIHCETSELADSKILLRTVSSVEDRIVKQQRFVFNGTIMCLT